MQSPVSQRAPTRRSRTVLIILVSTLLVCSFFGVWYIQHLTDRSTKITPAEASSNNGDYHTIDLQIDTSPTPAKTTTLLFFGDMMFDRGVRAQIKKIGYETVYGNFLSTISAKYDHTIANLEGPITSYPSKLIGADGRGIPGFTFTFPTSTASELKASGMDLVSLANNHTENFGSEGLAESVKWLNLVGLPMFGNPTNNDGASVSQSQQTRTICDTICISYIGYHEFTLQNEGSVVREIKRVRAQSDIIIIMPHWGVEYDHLPNSKQVTLAHQWIDAGADAIIGGHPHVIQSFEIYNNKPIFYSLGNFLFDQYFSYHTTHGLGVALTYTGTHEKNNVGLTQIELIPIDNTNIKTRETSPTDTQIMLKKLSDISTKYTATSTREQILDGVIRF